MKRIFIMIIMLVMAIPLSIAQDGWEHSDLSSITIRMGTASLGSKVYFAGGARGANLLPSNVVDVYDLNSRSWSMDFLSSPRELTAGVSSGSKLFFAGGINLISLNSFSTVDIFDNVTLQWSVAQLSQPRFSISALSYGTEVLFAGGVNFQTFSAYNTVDIYNTTTGVWRTASLSQPRGAMGATVIGSKAIFAGGFNLSTVTNRVDIYDFNTGIWSIDTLSLARGFIAATTVGNKAFFAGGITSGSMATDRVDIYDAETGLWTTSSISEPRGFMVSGASACGLAFFAGGGSFNIADQTWSSPSNIMDIYDPAADVWSTSLLSHRVVLHGVVENGDYVFIAGGTGSNDVYSTVDIFNCNIVDTDEPQETSSHFSLYPNPANDYLTIVFTDRKDYQGLKITDLTGKQIYKGNISDTQQIEVNTESLPEGIYMLQILTKSEVESQKFLVVR